MSFILQMNGEDISSLEELKQNLDIEKLLEHRHNFHMWLFGEDYEEEALAVKKLNTNLTNEQWLDAVAEICGFTNELKSLREQIKERLEPQVLELKTKKSLLKEAYNVITENKASFICNFSQYDGLYSFISHPFFNLENNEHCRDLSKKFSKELISEFSQTLPDIIKKLKNDTKRLNKDISLKVSPDVSNAIKSFTMSSFISIYTYEDEDRIVNKVFFSNFTLYALILLKNDALQKTHEYLIEKEELAAIYLKERLLNVFNKVKTYEDFKGVAINLDMQLLNYIGRVLFNELKESELERYSKSDDVYKYVKDLNNDFDSFWFVLYNSNYWYNYLNFITDGSYALIRELLKSNWFIAILKQHCNPTAKESKEIIQAIDLTSYRSNTHGKTLKSLMEMSLNFKIRYYSDIIDFVRDNELTERKIRNLSENFSYGYDLF